MDEPFSSLDAPTRESLQNLTLELQAEQNLTLLIVTHIIEEAAILGKKILLLRRNLHKVRLKFKTNKQKSKTSTNSYSYSVK